MTIHGPLQPVRTVFRASNRKFGLTMSAIFWAIGLWPIIVRQNVLSIWPFVIAASFFFIAIFAENLLEPLNLIWFKLGSSMHLLSSFFLMMLLFFVVITPMAIILKLFGKQLLVLNYSKSQSYWVQRSRPQDKLPVDGNQF